MAVHRYDDVMIDDGCASESAAIHDAKHGRQVAMIKKTLRLGLKVDSITNRDGLPSLLVD